MRDRGAGPRCDTCHWSVALDTGIVNANLDEHISVQRYQRHVRAFLAAGVQGHVHIWVVAWDPCPLLRARVIAWRRWGIFIGLLHCIRRAGAGRCNYFAHL